ncbi:hypothetical protein MCOR14_008725 [Pyricularia oryzae]|uniref:Uncharacterized protein n=1 Tax=Pyricularia oryzae TaxID=318829 RepID=A0A4P7NRC1_PYROR|nr:hypothetical protein MCOR34_004841 [Pyricularia oryzae]KAI6458257.1 hypothetical protein MCOR17_007466 [Pyricularia oryzae]KAI6497100.1 hypothetical protein MCOR13_006788 [Pyricularia oryzae]KAI6560808.1 hypothetical protein MCOR04_009630 [Pyricularia oryzae]KAI6627378.1 hypothetical protein MCOR14_008725 [Pyricularia oryzae]
MFWVVRCGLNWTATLSTEGISVTVDGYSYAGGTDIHIVVGVKNGDNFDCLFVGPTALPPNSTGSYQPQEQANSAAWTLATAIQSTASIHLTASLDKNGRSVSFEWIEKSGTTLSGQFTKKNTEAGTVEALGAHVDDTSARDTFDTALNACVADLPADENWTLGSD